MKLNPKVYKALVGEPFAVQEIDGVRVEFHYMDDTPYLAEYTKRGRFAIWTSDGKDYKVLIEQKYYETMKPFYEQGVNKIWLGFLGNVAALSRKINLWFLIPTMALYVILVTLFSFLWREQMIVLLIVMLVGVVVTNTVQSRIINKKVKEENNATQDKIKSFVGEETFNELVSSQEAFYAEYFKTNEPIKEEAPVTEEEKPEVVTPVIEPKVEETPVEESKPEVKEEPKPVEEKKIAPKTPTKKPAAKSSTAKKPAAKSSTAKKPTAKSSTAKKTTTKKTTAKPKE